MKQPYSHQYQPPAPVLSVRLYSFVSDKFSGPFTAIVDTGSDASLVPLAYLLELAAEETAPGWMVSITGQRVPVALYFVDVYVGDLALSGIRVIADENADEVILGRDVLNKLSLFLDGPISTLSVLDEQNVNRLR